MCRRSENPESVQSHETCLGIVVTKPEEEPLGDLVSPSEFCWKLFPMPTAVVLGSLSRDDALRAFL